MPAFISEGERIKVNTADGGYLERRLIRSASISSPSSLS